MSRALLIAGHGSARNPNTRKPICACVQEIRRRGGFDDVRCGLWKEAPSFAEAMARTTAEEVVVVPYFMAEGFYTREILPREMELEGAVTRRDSGQVVALSEAVGGHPLLAEVMLHRAREAGAKGDETLVVLGHGTPRNPNSAATAEAQADRLRAMDWFPEVITLFIDQEPLVTDVFQHTSRERIVVVPFFVADGWHVSETIPEDLGLDGDRLVHHGRELVYAKAVGADPGMVDVVLQRADEALALLQEQRP